MANPRQRQKQRTSRGKLTKRTGDSKKRVNIKGSAIIAAHWDKKQTLSQNYKRLGLVANPNINPSSGGVEKLYPDAPKAELTDDNGLKANEAIIRRDADGNVTEVIYSTINEAAESAGPEKTDVVKELEQRATEAKITPREASNAEVIWLQKIVEKYGQDYTRAARDKKLNPMQQTAANIKKRVQKALQIES